MKISNKVSGANQSQPIYLATKVIVMEIFNHKFHCKRLFVMKYFIISFQFSSDDLMIFSLELIITFGHRLSKLIISSHV